MPHNPAEPTFDDEAARLAALRDYHVLDNGHGHRLNDIAVLASHLCSAPMAFVSLVAEKRTFVESAVGIAAARAARSDPFCRHAIRQREVFEVPDTTCDARFRDHPLITAEPHIRFYAAAPLVAPLGHAVGALCVADFKSRHLAIEQHGALQILARLAVSQLELGVLALRDPLTGLYNRSYLDARLPRELARATRRHSPLSVVTVDVDHVGRINDAYGHKGGDAVLRAVSALLPCDVNQRNIACRLAGKRFLIVMPGTTADVAAARAESLRQTVASLDFRVLPGARQRITVSTGIAACPEHGATPEELLAGADHALRLAKAEGRNRVAVAPWELDFIALAVRERPASEAAKSFILAA
jgi:diguanylate cyclase (GGDEF)-like protein